VDNLLNIQNEEREGYLTKLEKNHQESLPNYTFYQLLEIFPEARPAMRRGLLTNIKKYKADLNESVRVENEGKKIIFNKTNDLRSQEFWLSVLNVFYIEPLRAGRENKIKQSRFYLSALKPKKASEVDPSKITDTDIARAKEVPIESLYVGKLNRQGSRATGQCPFHIEKTGSFMIYIKQNTFYCYGCNAGGDVIEYIMQSSKCNFLQAVKLLINK